MMAYESTFIAPSFYSDDRRNTEIAPVVSTEE